MTYKQTTQINIKWTYRCFQCLSILSSFIPAGQNVPFFIASSELCTRLHSCRPSLLARDAPACVNQWCNSLILSTTHKSMNTCCVCTAFAIACATVLVARFCTLSSWSHQSSRRARIETARAHGFELQFSKCTTKNKPPELERARVCFSFYPPDTLGWRDRPEPARGIRHPTAYGWANKFCLHCWIYFNHVFDSHVAWCGDAVSNRSVYGDENCILYVRGGSVKSMVAECYARIRA